MRNKTMLRIVSLVLTFVLSLSVLSIEAFAAETKTEKVSGADAIMAKASSQVGYYEGSGGYSKFGAYFGNPYIAWCGAFVSWCARESGISTSVIPTNLSSTAMRDHFKGEGLYYKSSAYGGSYIPKKGDIVFFTNTESYNRSQNNITHVGLVLDATSSYVTCIEGNCPDRVRQIDRKYTSYIAGYASPKYTGVASTNPNNEPTYKAGTYITNEVMNFRTAPGETVITTIPAKTTLEVTAIEGVWGKTVYNGKTGWISLQYSTYKQQNSTEDTTQGNTNNNTENNATDNNTTEETGTQYRVTEKMNIRASYTQSSKIIGSIPAGTLIQVEKVTSDNWGKVTFGGVTGWISLNWSVVFEPEVDWLVIDISQWQAPKDLDWAQLKENGVKGAIIRIGGRGSSGEKKIYDDKSFMEHYNAAKKAGLYVGVYFFSYALTKDEAIAEANYTINTLKENKCELDLPVYIDMEDLVGDSQHVNAGKNVCSMVLDNFCKTVEDAGYIAGIYCSRWFAEDFVKDEVFENRSTWIADWEKDVCCYSGNVDMWQYTENGEIKGSKYDLDFNRLYVDYPNLMKNQKFENGLIEAGDVDFDGNVSASDARIVLRAAVSLEKLSTNQKTIADMDKDGKITAVDAREILKTAVSR